jgi:hypothetical protein
VQYQSQGKTISTMTRAIVYVFGPSSRREQRESRFLIACHTPTFGCVDGSRNVTTATQQA